MPRITGYAFSKRLEESKKTSSPFGLEDLGLSEFHRAETVDIDAEIVETEQSFPESSLPGDKVKTMTVDKLIAGTIRSQEIQLAVIDGSGDVFIAAGKTDFDDVTNGFILGIDDSDSNKVKFIMGGATDYISMIDGTITLSGALLAGSIHIPDKDTTANSFHVETDGSGWVGATETNRATAPMRWTAAGALTVTNIAASGGVVAGFTLAASTMTATNLLLDAGNQKLILGTGNDVISLDAVDAGYRLAIGNSVYGSAPFRVTKSGAVTATNATITGAITATSGAFSGFVIETDYIKDVADSFGMASTVTGGDDVRFWAGDTFANRAIAPFNVTEAGNVTASTFTATNADTPESIFVVGKLSAVQDFTAGWDMIQGEVAVIESDDEVYPTRVFDFDELEDTEVNVSPGNAPDSKTVRINRTVAFGIYHDGSLSHQRIVYDPVDETITSISDGGSASTVTGSTNVIRMTDTTAITTGTAVNTLYGRVITGLDTTVTYGAEMTIDTDIESGRQGLLVRISDTTAIVFYKEKTTQDIKARILTVNGAVLTAGAEQAIHTAAGSLDFHSNPGSNGCARYGTSEVYIVAFVDNGTNQIVAVERSGSTLTPGSAINAGYSNKQADLCSLDDTRVAYGVLDGFNVAVKVISRSGTTLTANSPTTVDTSTNQNGRTFMTELGADSCCIGWNENTGGAGDSTSVQLVRFDGNTVSALGSSEDNPDNATGSSSVFKLTPELIGISQVGGAGGTGANLTYNFRSMSNNYTSTLGVMAETTAEDATGGIVLTAYCDDVSGLTVATTYYLGIDGTLITFEDGGLTKVGVALSSTEIKVTI